MSIVKIELQLASSTVNKTPLVRLEIDGGSPFVVSGIVGYTEVIFHDVALGSHYIDISLLNKDPSDTKELDGTVTGDLFCSIRRIIIDDHKFDHVDAFSEYTNDHGVKATNGFLSFNGTYRLKIKCPGYYFLQHQRIFSNETDIEHPR